MLSGMPQGCDLLPKVDGAQSVRVTRQTMFVLVVWPVVALNCLQRLFVKTLDGRKEFRVCCKNGDS